jgi:hypothetical protein
MSPSELQARVEGGDWFRRALLAVLSGHGPPATPASWRDLDPQDAASAKTLREALDRAADGDREQAARLAAPLNREPEGERWSAAALVARCLELLPILDTARRRQPRWEALLKAELDAEKDLLAITRRRGGTTPRPATTALLHIAQLELQLAALKPEPEDRAEDVAAFSSLARQLEPLIEAARELGLAGLVAGAGATLLDSLAEVVSLTARGKQWPLVARHRAWYLRWWHELKDVVDIERTGSELPSFTSAQCRAIGEQVGAMHSKNFVHGTLLLESFGWDAAVKNFGATEQLADWDAEAVVRDLSTLRHQLSPQQWRAFVEGYLLQDPAHASAVLPMVEARFRDERSRLEPLPLVKLHTPHFSVVACGYALRHFSESAVDFVAALETAAALEDRGVRARELADLSLQASGVDDGTALEAVRLLLSAVGELRQAGYPQVTLAVCEFALPRLAVAADSQRALLAAYTDEARAELSRDGDAAAESLRRAGDTLLRSSGRGLRQFGSRLLKTALERATHPAAQGEVIRTLLHRHLKLALENGDTRDLAAALDLVPGPESSPPPVARIVSAYDAARRALVAADAEQARRSLAAARTLSTGVPELAELVPVQKWAKSARSQECFFVSP